MVLVELHTHQGGVQMVKATGWQYGKEWSQEFTDVDEAMKFAFDACRANTLCVMNIEYGDGKSFNRDYIETYWSMKGWDPEATWITGSPSLG